MDELHEALAEMAQASMELSAMLQRRQARAFERLQRNYMPFGEALLVLDAVGWTRRRLEQAVRSRIIEKTYWRGRRWLLRRHVMEWVELTRRDMEWQRMHGGDGADGDGA
jgi:hypothetical protein